MDPIANPYNPGAGKRPAALVGRDDELTGFRCGCAATEFWADPDRSQMLTGLRGVGKTVLLGEFLRHRVCAWVGMPASRSC